MIKKNAEFKWGQKQNESFIQIREEIKKDLALMSPDFDKYFILYYFSSEENIDAILTQRNDSKEEHPISFMSRGLQ